MSYIVPKDKPTACRNCNFMDKITYDCKLMRMEDYPDFETQYANCPLIEVRSPEPYREVTEAETAQEKP